MTSLKEFGYVLSILSVLLIGIAAWRSVSQDQFLLLCLVSGIALSIVGMVLRWISHRRDRRRRAQA